MFHVFISYAHEDGDDYRIKLMDELKNEGFTDEDFWYDKKDIEPGEDWPTAIDRGISESYIVLVILTPVAVTRHYVTYEWSRALGDGVKVVPLLFETLPSKIEHPLVNRNQYVDCRSGVPQRVIEVVKEYKELPPDLAHLNVLIMEQILPLLVLSRFSLWTYTYAKSGLIQYEIYYSFLEKAHVNSMTGYDGLVDLVVSKSHAFTSKQKRNCRHIIGKVRTFGERLNDLVFRTQIIYPTSDYSELVEGVDNERESIWKSVQEWFGRHDVYQEFEEYISTLSRSELNKNQSENLAFLYGPYVDLATESLTSQDDIATIKSTIETIRQSKISKS